MNKSEINEVTTRFLEAAQYLKTKKTVRSYSVLAVSVGMRKQTFTNLRESGRNVTIEQAVNLCKLYGVSADWLFLGRGSMFGDTNPVTHEDLKALQDQLNRLKLKVEKREIKGKSEGEKSKLLRKA